MLNWFIQYFGNPVHIKSVLLHALNVARFFKLITWPGQIYDKETPLLKLCFRYCQSILALNLNFKMNSLIILVYFIEILTILTDLQPCFWGIFFVFDEHWAGRKFCNVQCYTVLCRQMGFNRFNLPLISLQSLSGYNNFITPLLSSN